MPATFTKAQASKLLNATEMKLFEESRINTLRAFSASQLDRRVERSRALRDKARDQLQRQRLAQRERTGSKRGTSGSDNQQRSKDKAALIADILKHFEGQLKVARRNEKAGIVPKGAPERRVTRKAAVSKKKAPDKDFTASRMRASNRIEEEAAQTMKARKTARKATAKKSASKASEKKTAAPAKKSAAKKKSATTKTAAKKPRAAKATGKVTKQPAMRPQDQLPGGDTSGKRTRSMQALNNVSENVHGGFADARSHNTAQQRKFQDALVTPIHAHISSRGRRNQGKRDQRG